MLIDTVCLDGDKRAACAYRAIDRALPLLKLGCSTICHAAAGKDLMMWCAKAKAETMQNMLGKAMSAVCGAWGGSGPLGYATRRSLSVCAGGQSRARR